MPSWRLRQKQKQNKNKQKTINSNTVLSSFKISFLPPTSGMHVCDSCAHVCWCMWKESSSVSLPLCSLRRVPQMQSSFIWLPWLISLLWGYCCCSKSGTTGEFQCPLAIYMVSGDLNSGPYPCIHVFYLTSHLPAPHLNFQYLVLHILFCI